MDATEHGETFKCAHICKMLAQLIQAGGSQARLISLAQSEQNTHVVLEMWSDQFNKWAVVDPDYNVHYAYAGVPLSSLELYEKSQRADQIKDIQRIAGDSPNTLFGGDTKLVENFYKNGFAIEFYNRWVDQNLPRRHPARSPAVMAYYLGESWLKRCYYKYDGSALTTATTAVLYAAPAAYSNADYLAGRIALSVQK